MQIFCRIKERSYTIPLAVLMVFFIGVSCASASAADSAQKKPELLPLPPLTVEETAQQKAVLARLRERIEKKFGKTLIAAEDVEQSLMRFVMDLDAATYAELLANLKVNNLTAYQNEKFIYIIPVKLARTAPIPTYTGGESFPADQYVSTFFTLNKICAKKLIPALRPTVSKQGVLAVLPDGRTFYMVDPYSNVLRIKAIAESMDNQASVAQSCD